MQRYTTMSKLQLQNLGAVFRKIGKLDRAFKTVGYFFYFDLLFFVWRGKIVWLDESHYNQPTVDIIATTASALLVLPSVGHPCLCVPLSRAVHRHQICKHIDLAGRHRHRHSQSAGSAVYFIVNKNTFILI